MPEFHGERLLRSRPPGPFCLPATAAADLQVLPGLGAGIRGPQRPSPRPRMSMRARYWPVMVLSASLPANGFAVMDDKHATPDFERVLGHQDRCYELSASGSSNLPSELLLAGTSHSPGVTRVAEARSPFLLSVDLEGQSRELAFTAKTGRFLELRGAVRLSDDAIVVAGVTSEGQVLELVDRTGKV